MKKVRAVQYGCGKMGKFLIRYLQEHGAEVVAAFDINEAVIGKDIGEISGTELTGVKVQPLNEAEATLSRLKPDVGVIATLSTMADLNDAFSLFARLGINAISTGEEALYPWNSSPEITKELDQLAKTTNCTLAGSGYPDMYWGVLIDTLAGSMHKLTKIKGSSCYNVEDYGIALAKGHGAGLTVTEFNQQIGNYNDLPYAEISQKIESGEYAPPYMWTQNGWLASRLGLTITNQTQRCVPQIATEDIYSDTLKMTVKKGDVLGLSALVITETAEGITLETECIGKILTANECDKNSWQFIGEPNTAIEVNNPATVELTCANLVNRIPALIKSPAGFITTEKMPNNVFMTKPMHEYL
ncbi:MULTISPECIES: NAD(P)H-dependent amine dehydrogenase family protein [Providencia]|uniref:Dihydrodipicolinate reductase n=2 Tax=Providencia TaxID=586 RepID=A0AAI9DD23_PROST|nr:MULTISPECIES: dihydrodipicolinate reductase [Providencia]ELR5038306.1 dihydrodipicolinate reductase [Providencia stuartii]ELR5081141.1 dihydrodipicolinate reductase [Providencia stuartii]ELR5113369.1 dihydrodipicolinate reductase [Providencia stuartii]MDX4946202.1 dihydrodipicolinate reductase [Providencia manganoxydans]QQO61787.1 dihydrodipicolinate reductase [Providencia manganoxydans]